MKIFGVDIGKSQKPATDQTEAVRAALTPTGTPVSRAFTVESGEQGDAMRHALAVIDRLHGDGAIPPLIAKRELLNGREGQFRLGQGVFIDLKSQVPTFTTVHEIGHVLDLYGFTVGRSEALHGHETMPVLDAGFASSAYRKQQALRTRFSVPRTDPIQDEIRKVAYNAVDYLLKPYEFWSRAYAQWVATISQDPILLGQLKTLQQDPQFSLFYVQWSDADFERIGREIELLFRRKGWLR